MLPITSFWEPRKGNRLKRNDNRTRRAVFSDSKPIGTFAG